MNSESILIDLYTVDGENALYDLSDGSLSDSPIGSAMGVRIYSAEALLDRIDGSEVITIRKVHVLANMIEQMEGHDKEGGE